MSEVSGATRKIDGSPPIAAMTVAPIDSGISGTPAADGAPVVRSILTRPTLSRPDYPNSPPLRQAPNTPTELTKW